MKYCSACYVSYSNDAVDCPVDHSVLRTTSELIQGLIIRGRYQILDKIGNGGMASVYRARHLHFDEIRAIKVVRGYLAEDDAFVRRLRSEAVISRKLQHPNAVRVDDLDTLEDGRPFIVMEYVEGPDLRKVIQSTGPLPLHRIVNVGSQVALALGAAHRLHIIHRDIKPDNIRLVEQPDGEELVKVLDFGIAKLQGAAAQTGAGPLTMTGMVVCTPDYASPEQARGANSSTLDGRSDLYSLGIVMYEMLTGELPFHSDTPIGMLMAQISTPPRSPSDIKPGLNIPATMSALLMKCLEKDPDKRFQCADELLDALHEVDSGAVTRTMIGRGRLFTMPQPRVPTSPPQPAPAVEAEAQQAAPPDHHEELTVEIRQAERRRQMMLRVLTAVAALVLTVGGLAWWWHRPSTPAQPQTVASTESTDTKVLADVNRALQRVKDGGHIVAAVSAGAVHLSGRAPSEDVVDEAALRAARVPGVASVDKSGVQVTPAPTPPAAATNSAAPPSAAGPNASNSASPPVPIRTAASDVPSQNGESAPGGGALAAAPPGNAPLVKYREKPEVEQLLTQARQELDQGQFDKALASCDSALRLDPRSPAARKQKQKTLSAQSWFNSNNQ